MKDNKNNCLAIIVKAPEILQYVLPNETYYVSTLK